MKALLSVTLAVLAGNLFCDAQSDSATPIPDEPLLKLTVGAETVVNEPGGILMMPSRCDTDGNILFRRYDEFRELSEPISKIGKDGTIRPAISLNDNRPDLRGLDFYVAPDGEVFRLANDREGTVYVQSYSSNGVTKDLTKFDTKFVPYYFGVYPSGQYLIAGLERPVPKERGGPVPSGNEPFTAVFSADGRLIRQVNFSDDDRLVKAINDHDESSVPPGRASRGALTFASVIPGVDGNLYLWRNTKPLILYAVSPAGEVVRRITIDSGQGLLPQGVLSNKGRVAVLFAQSGVAERIIVVADLSSGEVLEQYRVDPSLGVALSCFSDAGFTFLGERQGKLALITAAVK